MTIEFDKNIPIPDPVVRTKYEFDRMDVGDSKFWPGSAAVKSVEAYQRKSGKKFTKRKTRENHPSSEDGSPVVGYRIWRTE